MRFGLSTHLFHNERLERKHLEAIAAAGFAAVEIFATRTHLDYHDRRRVLEVGSWLHDTGLAAVSMHAPICESFANGAWGRAYSNASMRAAVRQEALDETTAALDAARHLGCGMLVVHLGLPRGQKIPPDDNDATAARHSAEALAAAAREAGIRLAVELIPNTLSTSAALEALLGGDLDLGDAGVCLDLGHAHLMGGVPEAAEALSGHIITTHVHDNDGKADTHLVPGAGNIDWPFALTALGKIGYAGPLIFEVADHGDAAATLRRTVGARTRLQAILDDLAQPLMFSEEP
jgi:sugar phosphate isomerase/epimerase